MTRDEAIAMIKQLLGFRRDQDAQIALNMQLVQDQLEINPIKPWFLLSEITSIRMTIDEPRIRLPDNFLEEYEYSALYYDSDVEDEPDKEVLKEDLDQLNLDFKNSEPGPPQYYSLDGNYFRIFPTPDDTYLLKMLYYKRDDRLTSNIENQWLKWVPYLLIGKAGMLSATGLRDKTAFSQFSQMANEGLILLNTQNEARKHSNRSYQIGGPH